MSNRLPHQERTLVILKTDTVQRSLVGEIVSRFERSGLKISAMKMVFPTQEQLEKHYNKDDEWCLEKGERVVAGMKDAGQKPEKEAIEYGRDIVKTIVGYLQEAPVIVMILEGGSAVEVVTKLVGTTEPSTADVGTIRGDFTIDSYDHSTIENRAVKNLVHYSDDSAEAEREIDIWFESDEIHNYISAQERIMYELNKDKQ